MKNLKTTKIEAGNYNVTRTDTGDTFEVYNDTKNPTWGNIWTIDKLNGGWISGDPRVFGTLKETKAYIREWM